MVSNRPQDIDKPKANTLLVGGTHPTVKKELIFLGGIRNKDWAKDGKDYSRNFGQGDRVYSPEGKSTTLSALGGGRGAKTGLYAVPVALRNRGEGKKPEYNGTDKANAMTSVQTDSMVAFKIPEATKKGYALATEGQSYVIKSLNTKEVLNEFTVLQSVDILTESIGSLSNQNIQPELHLFVMDVEKNIQNNNLKSEEDFAHYLASINIIEAKIILTGLEVLHLKGSSYIQPKNGNKLLDKSGQEINHFVTNVAYTIKNQDTPIISTTLNHLRLEKMIEQMLTILSCYASNAIDGFTLKEILINNSWICPITNKEIKQLNYFDKAEYKGKPISNTQRYKMCGNAFNCKVIEHILKHLDLSTPYYLR